MKFKTLKTSDTGIRFRELLKKIRTARAEQKELIDNLGFRTCRIFSNRAICGGVSTLIDPNDDVDLSLYKKCGDGFLPRKSHKKGKIIQEKIDNLSVVFKSDANKCVGLRDSFNSIGYNLQSNSEYFLFEVNDLCEFTPKDDCEEIISSEYKKLSEI